MVIVEVICLVVAERLAGRTSRAPSNPFLKACWGIPALKPLLACR